MVFSRCAMQSSVDEENSDWIVRWTLESVSTSTLLVASSCTTRDGQSSGLNAPAGVVRLTRTMMRLFFTSARHSARSCFSPAL